MLLVDGSQWQSECTEDENCKSAVLNNVRFMNNGAVAAGAAIFATDPRNVYVQPDDDGDAVPFVSGSITTLPGEVTNNSIASGGFGDFASVAQSLTLISPEIVENKPEQLVGFIRTEDILGHNSSDPLPAFILEVKDFFGETVTRIPDASKFKTPHWKCVQYIGSWWTSFSSCKPNSFMG